MRFLWKDVIRIGVLTAILHQRWQWLSSSGRLNARLLSSNAWSGGPCSDLCTSCMQQVTCSTMQVPTAANIKGKGTPMVSTAADSRPCDARVWCSSPFHWSWASSELAPGTMDSKPHLFHNLPLPPRFYAGTNLYCMREAHECKQFAYSHQTTEPNRGLKRRPLECQSNALMLCSLCC